MKCKKILGLCLFVLSLPTHLFAQLNDVQTSFEFIDLDGRFTIGQCYGCVVFENGEAKSPPREDLFLNGVNAWMVKPGRTGSVEFVAPAASISLFFKDEDETVGSVMTIFDSEGEVIQVIDGSDDGAGPNGFIAVSVNGTSIKKITLQNNAPGNGPTVYVVLENFQASFEQDVTTIAVHTFYLPRFADGRFFAGGSDNIFTTEGIFTNGGPFSQIELKSFDDQGDPLAITIEAPNRTTDSEFLFEVLEGEGIVFTTVGLGDGSAAQNLIAGYWSIDIRRVESDAAKPGEVGAIAIFKRSQEENGPPVLLFETGIPAVRPIAEFSISLDSMGEKDTGLAMVNPAADQSESTEEATAHVLFSVWEPNGEDLITLVRFDLSLVRPSASSSGSMFEISVRESMNRYGHLFRRRKP